MPAQSLYLPDSPHGTAFRALADWLKSDPKLKTVVRSWRTWEGDKAEDVLDPTINQVPWVRLTPQMGPIEPLCILGYGKRSFSSPLIVIVETSVGGTLVENSATLWDAIFDRVMGWPVASYNAAGICDVYPTKPAQTANSYDVTLADGAFRLEIYVTG